MFGFDAWAKKAHLVSHLIVAASKWLLEPSNPVMTHIPGAVQPELKSFLSSEMASRQAVLDEAAKSQ